MNPMNEELSSLRQGKEAEHRRAAQWKRLAIYSGLLLLVSVSALIRVFYLYRATDKLLTQQRAVVGTLTAANAQLADRTAVLEKIAPPAGDILFGREPIPISPRPIRTADDLKWYFATDTGEKILSYYQVPVPKRELFIGSLRAGVSEGPNAPRWFYPADASVSGWKVRIVDAVVLEHRRPLDHASKSPAK